MINGLNWNIYVEEAVHLFINVQSVVEMLLANERHWKRNGYLYNQSEYRQELVYQRPSSESPNLLHLTKYILKNNEKEL